MVRHFLNHFARNRDGATIVEFAIVAPVFFLLMLGIVEFGLIGFSNMALEAATSQVARDASIGKTSSGACTAATDTVGYAQCAIRERTNGLINHDQIIITANTVSNGGAATSPDICLTEPPTVGGSCPPGTPYEDVNKNNIYDGNLPPMSLGVSGDLVEMRVFYPWKVQVPFMKRFLGGIDQATGERTGAVMLVSNMVIKNEPF